MTDSRTADINKHALQQLSQYCTKEPAHFQKQCNIMLNGWPGIFGRHQGQEYGVGVKHAIPPLEFEMAYHFQSIDAILYKLQIEVGDIPKLSTSMLALSSAMKTYMEESNLLLTHYKIGDEMWKFRNSIGFVGQDLQLYTTTMLKGAQGNGQRQARDWDKGP